MTESERMRRRVEQMEERVDFEDSVMTDGEHVASILKERLEQIEDEIEVWAGITNDEKKSSLEVLEAQGKLIHWQARRTEVMCVLEAIVEEGLLRLDAEDDDA